MREGFAMNHVMLRVNGIEVAKAVAPRTHLADFVREELNLTGTHLGCEHGVCGACTMIVDGRPIRSCLSYAVGCAGSDVRTIEAFDDDPVMGLLRGAFSRHHALQCGYCTPGMLATAYDIVTRLPEADEARIREELSGNLCRCTGYEAIVDAVEACLEGGRS
jgi:carbon-monoxide dehydrogenase small subunit